MIVILKINYNYYKVCRPKYIYINNNAQGKVAQICASVKSNVKQTVVM